MSTSAASLKLDPLVVPFSPAWHKERAGAAKKAEIIGEALTFLNQRTQRQQMMGSVKTFKAETTKLIAEQREAGTPDRLCAEALLAQAAEVSPQKGAARSLNFGSSLQHSPSRGQLPAHPDHTKGGNTLDVTLGFLNLRSKAQDEGKEMAKVETIKDAIGQPLTEAMNKGVPEFLIEEALHETLTESGIQV